MAFPDGALPRHPVRPRQLSCGANRWQTPIRLERRCIPAPCGWIRARFSAQQLAPGAPVGFERNAALEQQLAGALRHAFREQTGVSLKELDRVILENRVPDSDALEGIFGKPGKLQLGYTVGQEQSALADRIVLVHFQLPEGQPSALSIGDVLRRQNVQGRMEFFNRNISYMLQQARSHVANLLVFDWAVRRFGASQVADLRQALADHDDVRAGMALFGLAEDVEAASLVQATLARQVTQQDIDAYYKAHKDQFRRLERVRARHITVDSEERAAALVAQLRKGASFAALARSHSTAADAASGGDLGWVRADETSSWLASLALQQERGKVSNPLRAPVGPGERASWEIILVEQRQEGHHPAESETVRYQARRAIAHQRARDEFASTRRQAMLATRIEVLR
jgi:hypothetical protein